ncbi:MAG: cytochrome c oxidase subunit II [Flavobacteriaceae bacterium]
MKALFYIAVFAAIAIAFWQINKLLGFTKGEQIASKKENNVNGWLMLAMLVFVHGLLIYCMVAYGDVLLPQLSASAEGEHIDLLFKITFGLILVVQFFTQILLFFFSFKYRGNVDRKATFFADSHRLEMFWTGIPAIVLTALVLYGIWTWNKVMDVQDKGDNPLYIEVYAKQFNWEARYAGADNALGEANVRNIKGINTMGVDMTDKNSIDDIPVRELHLPKGRKVVFQFRSQDVLHSAYMPHFRAQMNVVPGQKTYFGFTPSVTTKDMRLNEDIVAKVAGINKIRKAKSEELVAVGDDALEPYVFDYLLLCNKICGNSHYNMQMKIVVEEEADFNKWYAKQKAIAIN